GFPPVGSRRRRTCADPVVQRLRPAGCHFVLKRTGLSRAHLRHQLFVKSSESLVVQQVVDLRLEGARIASARWSLACKLGFLGSVGEKLFPVVDGHPGFTHSFDDQRLTLWRDRVAREHPSSCAYLVVQGYDLFDRDIRTNGVWHRIRVLPAPVYRMPDYFKRVLPLLVNRSGQLRQ